MLTSGGRGQWRKQGRGHRPRLKEFRNRLDLLVLLIAFLDGYRTVPPQGLLEAYTSEGTFSSLTTVGSAEWPLRAQLLLVSVNSEIPVEGLVASLVPKLLAVT